ncbi:hypothetical protein [Pseudoalteromonas maricaloris]|uniref:hypothetical protein n=1 Tax=Pseudoalteromonas maricaloris TaxID=184924 RepID=UPI00057E5E7C|nr:hypothetical protein [Pseudoalteromonas flavipulchra]KID36209.1 hypothetical protein QT15_11360 [Pseudoalteromonas flavipulchra NCIMB 2033 = ATCC BAA-314]MBD0780380.1 hypothetical protein [Pseudoalteromonas flavipulchra]MBE0371652.1 hypothetical protein [Pseudoalteromonas flavipulchra NCIMB 2033 = ATCC BAA-314]
MESTKVEPLNVRISQYIEHWKSKPNSPASIGWLESIFNRLKVGIWRPIDEKNSYVDHRLISHNRATYEELIPDLCINKLTDEQLKEVEDAQKIEIKHRIFKAIYWGNLFDDITPIETRHYTASTDRLTKIFFMATCLCAVIFFMTFITPSWIVGTFSTNEAIPLTSKSPLRKYIIEENLAEKFFSAASSVKHFEIPHTNGQTELEFLIELRKVTDKTVKEANISTEEWVNSLAWKASTEHTRRNAISDAVFFDQINGHSSIFNRFNKNSKFVLMPSGNLHEVFSQLVVTLLIVVMISFFVAKKNHFFQVIQQIPFEKRIPSIHSLEETLMSFFFLRKKYHYIVAITVAFTTLFCHYYMVKKVNFQGTYEASTSLGLTPFDFRLESVDQPLWTIYWVVQFLIIYMFTLVTWELGALNSCFKQWQGRLLKSNIIAESDFNASFSDLFTMQKISLLSVLAMSAILLTILSVSKFFGLEPNFELNLSSLDKLATWDNLLTLYIFSPPILTFILIYYAINPCFREPQKAVAFSQKKLPDFDETLEYFMSTWKNLKVAEKWASEQLLEFNSETVKNEIKSKSND